MKADGNNRYLNQELRLLWTLIRDAATMAPAQSLLKARMLPSSASSWDELWEKRVFPAHEEGQITDLDLANLLREHEETGHQHVFLYCCKAATARRLMAGSRLRRKLAEHTEPDVDEALMVLPKVVDKPARPRVVDVRIENGKQPKALVLKVVETRENRRQVDSRSEDGQEIEVYETEKERAVNLFRLHRSGLLELRIQSHSAKNYRKNLGRMWALAGDLLPFGEFRNLSLVHPRHMLWEQRGRLVGQLRFRELHLRNDMGTTIQLKSHLPEEDIAADAGAVRTINTFLRNEGEFALVDVYWQEDKELRPLPSRDVHMQIAGEVNEFKISGGCAKKDYEYVVDRLGARC